MRPPRSITMTLSEFQERVAAASQPVLVDFWAEWCAPCRAVRPVLEKLAVEYANRVLFLPIDADKSPEVLAHYNILGLPTVLALRNGADVGRATGARNEAVYRTMFESLAAGAAVSAPMTSFDRVLRLGAGALFMLVGSVTGVWLLAATGAILAFTGIYDRCPIWSALTSKLRSKQNVRRD